MKKIFAFVVVTGLLMGGSGIASALTLFDRGLPDSNLNNASGSSRSNVAWAEGGTLFDGDTFSIGTTGQAYVIDSLTVWGIQAPLGTGINNIDLYMGMSTDPLALLLSGSVTGNSNISFTQVNYPGGTTNYQGTSGTLYPLMEATFSNLNYVVQGGVTYNFGVNGTGGTGLWYNHASNAGLSGTTQDGADGNLLVFDTSNLSYVAVWDSNGSGWDKSSDINVRITGAPVPIPGALVLFGSGLLGLVGIGRKRLQK